MLKEDEIIEKLDEKFEIIQKVGGYKYGEDTILLFKLFQASLNKKNIKLLDIGTGNGILPILLSDNEFLSELIGIDIQKENIDRANKALELNKIEKNIQFKCMDIREYKNSNYFDVIISNSKRLLKPIGSLYFIHRTHRLVEIIKTLDKNNFSVKKIIFIYSAQNNKSTMMFVEAIKGKKVKLEIENYYI